MVFCLKGNLNEGSDPRDSISHNGSKTNVTLKKEW